MTQMDATQTGDEVATLRAENEALRGRLEDVAQRIEAQAVEADTQEQYEWPADLAARGRWRGMRDGLMSAARIVRES